jgi:hypothetical protein
MDGARNAVSRVAQGVAGVQRHAGKHVAPADPPRSNGLVKILMVGSLGYFAALIASRRIATGALTLLSRDEKVRLVDEAAKRGRLPLPLALLLMGFVSLAWWPRQHLVTGWRVFCLLFLGYTVIRSVRALVRLRAGGYGDDFLQRQRFAATIHGAGALLLAAAVLLAFR